MLTIVCVTYALDVPHIGLTFSATAFCRWYYNCKALSSLQRQRPPDKAPVTQHTVTPSPQPVDVEKSAVAPTNNNHTTVDPEGASPKPPPPQLPGIDSPGDKMQPSDKEGASAAQGDFDNSASNATADTAKMTNAPAETATHAEGPKITSTQQPQPETPQNKQPEVAARSAPIPTAVAAPKPVDMGLQYPGVSADEFKSKYAEGSLSAVAKVAGVEPSVVEQVIKPVGAARRLLQDAASKGVDVTYSITSADRDATLQRLVAATANNGAGLYDALAAAGVPLHPAVSINGVKTVKLPANPQPTAREAAATALASQTNTPQPAAQPAPGQGSNNIGTIVGAVVGSVLGALLLVVLALLAVRYWRRRKAAAASGAAPSTGVDAAPVSSNKGVAHEQQDIEMARDAR